MHVTAVESLLKYYSSIYKKLKIGNYLQKDLKKKEFTFQLKLCLNHCYLIKQYFSSYFLHSFFKICFEFKMLN